MDVAELNSKCVSRDKDQNIFQSGTIACYTTEREKREEKETFHHQLPSLYIQSVRYPRIVTAQERMGILGNNSRKIQKARKELCYGKAETLEDAEEAARWWRYNLVR